MRGVIVREVFALAAANVIRKASSLINYRLLAALVVIKSAGCTIVEHTQLRVAVCCSLYKYTPRRRCADSR